MSLFVSLIWCLTEIVSCSPMWIYHYLPFARYNNYSHSSVSLKHGLFVVMCIVHIKFFALSNGTLNYIVLKMFHFLTSPLSTFLIVHTENMQKWRMVWPPLCERHKCLAPLSQKCSYLFTSSQSFKALGPLSCCFSSFRFHFTALLP